MPASLFPPTASIACFTSCLQGSGAGGRQRVGAWLGQGGGSLPGRHCLSGRRTKNILPGWASKASSTPGGGRLQVEQSAWQGAVQHFNTLCSPHGMAGQGMYVPASHMCHF